MQQLSQAVAACFAFWGGSFLPLLARQLVVFGALHVNSPGRELPRISRSSKEREISSS